LEKRIVLTVQRLQLFDDFNSSAHLWRHQLFNVFFSQICIGEDNWFFGSSALFTSLHLGSASSVKEESVNEESEA